MTLEEREELLSLLRGGQTRVRKTNRARILLLAHEGRTDEEVAEALLTSVSTVERTRKRLVEGGLERALNESPRPGGKRKLTGKQAAYVVALACSDPPEGKKRWSMRLLADRLVELGVVEEISDETVRRTLKRGGVKPWLKKQWCIPEGGSGVCVAHGGCARALRGAL